MSEMTYDELVEERALADRLATKAMVLAQVVSYPKQHSNADLWNAVSELNAVLGDHRERRERDG